jgi:hypothetical protein|tara:strand:+ start:1125 stop:1919 length:795 start_codon:yes stop_codon:yes gene_type:complete
MSNFVLCYPLLENKKESFPYECEWCGDNFGGHKRKYCTPKCREEEKRYDAYKEKQERFKKREIKKVEREKEKQKKRIAKLDKELAKLRQENKKYKCVVCDNELTGNQTLYCSTQCNNLARLDDRKRPTPAESIFSETGKWHEGHYGKCNVNIVESKNCLEVIDLAPYTYESDYYIEKCIMEELPQAKYSDGTIHIPHKYKSVEYYYGNNFVKAIGAEKKKVEIKKIINVLKKRIKDLDGKSLSPCCYPSGGISRQMCVTPETQG